MFIRKFETCLNKFLKFTEVYDEFVNNIDLLIRQIVPLIRKNEKLSF